MLCVGQDTERAHLVTAAEYKSGLKKILVDLYMPSSYSTVHLPPARTSSVCVFLWTLGLTAGFIKIGPFYVDYPIGLSNSGWRGNFAELFSHPKIFVVIKK